MSMLKVDKFIRFFIFDILILSHSKEGVGTSTRKDITVEKLMLEGKKSE